MKKYFYRFRRLSDKIRLSLKLLVINGSMATVFVGVWAFYVEPDQLSVREVPVQISRLPRSLGPLKVAVMSDLHVGAPHVDLQKLQALVEMTNKTEPDVIVLLGDYVIHGVIGGKFVEPEEFGPVLKNLKARYGVYAVLGNHDWWYDGPRIIRALEKAGIKVLEDKAVALPLKGQSRLWLAGLGDEWTRQSDIQGTFSKILAKDAVLVLTHNPALFQKVPSRAFLTLAGHTHGGQIRVPRFIQNSLIPKAYRLSYPTGLTKDGDRHLYVTPGVGTGGVPARLGIPPEVSILTLSGDS